MDNQTAAVNAAVAKAIGVRVVADGTKKLRLRCVKYGESTAHYADAVVVSATSIVLSIDGAADTTFAGASGTLLFETYTDLGKLVDEINSSPNWEAEIVAGTRDDAINGSELLARSTSTFRMWQEVNIYADSSDSGVYRVGVLLEPGRAFDSVHRSAVAQTFKDHRVGLKRHKSLVNTGSAEATTVTVYELDPTKATRAAANLKGQWTGADDTLLDSGSQDEVIVHADPGNCLLVEVASTGWVDSGAYLEVNALRE